MKRSADVAGESKLETARRRNAQANERRRLQSCLQTRPGLQRLETATLVDADLSVREEREVRSTLGSLRRSKRLVVQSGLSRAEFTLVLKSLRVLAGNRRFKVFLFNWQALGAIALTTEELVELGIELLSLDGDSVYGRDDSGEFIFLLDYSADNREREFEFAYARESTTAGGNGRG